MAKIHITTDTSSHGVITRARPVRARHLLVFIWLSTVAVPWLLQVRSFAELVVRHKITQNLIPSPGALKQTDNVTELCLVQALHLAGTWWNADKAHYYRSDDVYDGSVLCHFIIPQYSIHGAYHVQNRKIPPAPTAPSSCANESYPVNYYFYHGSIGYYSFYDEGDGSFCRLDNTVYIVSSGIGTNDINFSALANFKGTNGYHMSYYFAVVGFVWLGYRAIVLRASIERMGPETQQDRMPALPADRQRRRHHESHHVGVPAGSALVAEPPRTLVSWSPEWHRENTHRYFPRRSLQTQTEYRPR